MVNQGVVEEIHNTVLDVGTVDLDPLKQFRRWYKDALRTEIFQPEAMHLSTAGRHGIPTGRFVLYKEPEKHGLPEGGLLFFTNFQSPKSRDIEEFPRVALTFFWKELRRQIRIQGTAQKVPDEVSDKYFETRPEGSKLGAWASSQSEVIEGRGAMEERVAHFRKKFEGGTIPRPKHWGGFIVRPRGVEFWQHRDDRLHDRIWYELQKDGSWTIQRLSP